MNTDPILDEFEIESNKETLKPKYDSIGGWLVLIAIGLILSPFSLLFGLYTSFADLLDPEIWANLSLPEIYHPLLKPLIYFEAVGNFALLVFSIIVAYYFFNRKKELPRLITFMYAGSLIFLLIDAYLSSLIPIIAEDSTLVAEQSRSVIQALISAAIWIPYFNISERVKGTFVY